MRGVKHRMRLAANDFNEHDNFRGFEMTRTGRTLTIVACVLAMPAAAQAATVHLKSDLLTLKQLPQGWLAASASTSSFPGCNASAFPTGSTALVGETFNFEALKAFPIITEDIASYKNVAAAFTTLTTGLGGCTQVTGTKNGSPITGSISRLSFSSVGDKSLAFVGTLHFESETLSVDILVVRKGDLLMELQYGNTSAIGTAPFKSVVTAALHKL